MSQTATQTHTFHIPVMGIGFTIDTPVKVAHWGISSVVSLVDDMLAEKMRAFHSQQRGSEYTAIGRSHPDHRAARFTAYLNLLHDMVQEKFAALKDSMAQKSADLDKFLSILPERSELKRKINDLLEKSATFEQLRAFFEANLRPGSIDVNIMTKLDKTNYKAGQALPDEYNDAHAALRGFAQSQLSAGIVLSAGMNPKLYNYMGSFADFKPDANGQLRKRVILKVSDYRSALIQGKVLAKKGIWVSEYRIESGLNCGGHAFATEGVLIGPILQEFKEKRDTLYKEVYAVYRPALEAEGIQAGQPAMHITAQGGVGDNTEHQFLLEHYGMDSVGWGTPFLLAPDVCNVDPETLSRLAHSTEDDLYLSGISPLGVPFNNLRTNTKSVEWQAQIDAGKPGSACPKRYVALHLVNDRPMCISSQEYQAVKLREIEQTDASPLEKERARTRLLERDCICVGLGTSALIVNQLDTRTEGPGVSICPGPNMAYYTRQTSLVEMCNHIYGRTSVLENNRRPNMFLKELSLYLDYYFGETTPIRLGVAVDGKKLEKVRKSILEGIAYYKTLFAEFPEKFGNGLCLLAEYEQKLIPVSSIAV